MGMLGSSQAHGVVLSKLAMNDGHGENSSYFDGWKAYDKDPYHPINNPNGVIQMGLAENQLCFDLVKEWILKNPRASICTSEGVNDFKDIAIFQDYHGLPEFRNAIAKFMGRVRGNKVTFDPERVVMSGGATGANETLMFCLANRGDAFLIPSPYYPAFDRDLGWRTGVKLIPVPCHSSNDFKITKEALESTYSKAITESNINIKGLILANPSNPLGTFLDKETLTCLVNFINDKQIHLVCDEIYAATVFTSSPEFISISEIIDEMMDDVNRGLIHMIYSLSKDMGFPGFRVGIIYSYNDVVVSCARKMSSFGLVSAQTQYLLASMLSDDEFVERFVGEGPKRLRKRHEMFVDGISQVGISCLKSNAGLFVWMDLRPLLDREEADLVEAELKLWRVIINDVKINVSPGSSFHCCEPGWFRVCYANMDDETLEIALNRIKMFVYRGHKEGIKGGTVAVMGGGSIEDNKKKRWRRRDLRLSFGSAGGGNSHHGSSSPHLVSSPHSPIPHSPLLKA